MDRVIETVSGFQPTLPQGERHQRIIWKTMVMRDFNPRSRKGSDPAASGIPAQAPLFQPTLPQGERHISPMYSNFFEGISTHAPARGATMPPSSFIG